MFCTSQWSAFRGVIAALASCVLAAACASSKPPPLPTVPGPEQSELLSELRGSLIWASSPQERMIHVREYPGQSEYVIETEGTVVSLAGPSDDGWIAYLASDGDDEGALYVRRLGEKSASRVVRRYSRHESIESIALCTRDERLLYALHRSVKVPGRSRRGAEDLVVVHNLSDPQVLVESITVPHGVRSLACGPTIDGTLFVDDSEERNGEGRLWRLDSTTREWSDTGIGGEFARVAADGEHYLVDVRVQGREWTQLDRAFEQPQKVNPVVAHPVEFLTGGRVIALALPTQGHRQRYHVWWAIGAWQASYPLKLIDVSSGSGATLLAAEPYACSFGTYVRS